MKKLFAVDDSMPKSLQKGKSIFIFALLIVPVINFIIFYLVVNANSFVLAFQEYAGFGEYKVSFGQFKNLFADLKLLNDGKLFPAFKNTMMYFWLNLLFTLPFSFFISYFLYKKVMWSGFFRVVFFMPSIISSVVLVAVYKNFLLPSGPIATFLKALTGTGMPSGMLLYHDSATALMVGFVLWTGFGVNIVLFESAMRRIPESVIEAGMLDGVGMIREMFLIVMPLVWSTVLTTLTLAISAFLTADGPILLFTEGGAETSTISFYIYWIVKEQSAHNYGASIGIFCSLLSMPIVFTSRYFLTKAIDKVEY